MRRSLTFGVIPGSEKRIVYFMFFTPFTPDGEIDKHMFAVVVESLIDAGVHGIILGGSTGEYYAQTADERFALAVYAKDVIRGRPPHRGDRRDAHGGLRRVRPRRSAGWC
jgi:Dihydrodipicolinate synthetase family